MSHKRTWFSLADLLTLVRLLLAPYIAFHIIHGSIGQALFLFMIAAATDSVDGWLARRLDNHSFLGKYLDPIADKTLLLTTFGALFFVQESISSWFFIFLVWREILLLGGAFIFILLGKATSLAPSRWGKLNTFFQILFIGWIFISKLMHYHHPQSTLIIVILIMVFSVASCIDYLYRGIRSLYK